MFSQESKRKKKSPKYSKEIDNRDPYPTKAMRSSTNKRKPLERTRKILPNRNEKKKKNRRQNLNQSSSILSATKQEIQEQKLTTIKPESPKKS